ncbi:tautomerase family protein [Paraburkholderia sp. DHOC27]|uniref:tautomerase family protein n=1 Tax=Paraburkholderia sp. DHOC27 TaxID=2303330 RepID=UPI000E3E6CD2|nr:tautomerase family protein [Paraburkholderia sp. DHOC27]RFU45195.1 tautomerase family protein [Paraburkholderia sp. DHOC27]
MPLVRISLLKGKSPEQIRTIADGVHQALVETYNVPEKDRFQIIEQRSRGEIIYDKDYLDIERTDGIVIIHMTAGRWRDTATKKALYRRIAKRLSDDAGIRPEDVQVILSPNERDDWSFGNGLASYVPDAE